MPLTHPEGLTPACAGTSHPGELVLDAGGAHPRVRGDVEVSTGSGRPESGSPPRARGRLFGAGREPRGHGLTPACAGTSQISTTLGVHAGAHPRVRGDVRRPTGDMKSNRGSPPRARGRRRPADRPVRLPGLTPACAGTSGDPLPHAQARRAHPRVRGDVDRGPVLPHPVAGSPPRARGRPRPRKRCAGCSRAHPRVRGDVKVRAACGHLHRGLTPACAGTS